MRTPWDPFPARIAVFRALQLGDLLCAVPALRALRAFAPRSRITLVSLPWAASFVERFHRYVDDLLVFPGFPGFPERDAPAAELRAFAAAAGEREFDLALQMHGRGELSNVLTMLLGASRHAGFRPEGKVLSEPGFTPWPDQGSEIERCLRLMDFLGVPRAGEDLEMPLTERDLADYAALARGHRLLRGRFVCVHPGARLRSRRWPLERFAAVVADLARDWRVVITGTRDEEPLIHALLRRVPRGVSNLAGETTLGSLSALIRDAALLVCNDTGVSHVAAAMRTPSVVVASGSDVARWAPLDTRRHRVLWQDVPCRPCAYEDCPFGHPCALGVEIGDVIREARELLDERIPHAA
jgi:ADP-heptose:LPS heptosyltransferase